MKSGYVVLTDYDGIPFIVFYGDHAEAKKEFNRRIKDKNQSSFNSHLCQTLESFTSEGNK
ncbi:hypothetical protein [Bacillus pumilus]|uniref:hypothetical protein n=1 Tax=Bacillus pumilus TaxID=1408 RepID=UPI00227FFDB6|nr:hypothetical protein [Bacillus pumilus]MCY7572860.1 hypothetical protein [Bacillus pumilus]MCY7578244.1 hypothetical protein [Bacillus pumilus]MEC3761273.1 hypothetical protein [Bacillus pumilus]